MMIFFAGLALFLIFTAGAWSLMHHMSLGRVPQPPEDEEEEAS